MGLTNLTIQIANPSRPNVFEPVDFLIDSGATYSVVPRPVLERLGIPKLVPKIFRVAFGQQTIERWIGMAIFRYQGSVGGGTVIFGAEGDATLLGVVTLEQLGYDLYPLRRELIPLPMMP